MSDPAPKVLDLFAGIGGFSLGLERAGYQTVCLVERDPFCAKVLNKNFPGIPIYGNVETVTEKRLRSNGIDPIDTITAGFPCQPYSRGNWKRKGREDTRDCVDETIRLVSEFKPALFIGENTEGFIDIGLEAFIDDLAEIGYYAESFSIPSCSVGLPTVERHVWIIAAPIGKGLQRHVEKALSIIDTLQGEFRRSNTRIPKRWNTSKSRVCRVGEGISRRLDRLRVKAVGNAVDPTIVEIIGRLMLGETVCLKKFVCIP